MAPRTGSFKTSFTMTAKPIPVRPRTMKILLQSTSSPEPIKDAVTKYAAIIPIGIPIE